MMPCAMGFQGDYVVQCVLLSGGGAEQQGFLFSVFYTWLYICIDCTCRKFV